jgi:hypothetical protein
MSCDRIQSGVSRAIDDGGDLTAFEDHLSACSECADFAGTSEELAARYRRQVLLGIDRLRSSTPALPQRRSRARGLFALAAAALVLCSILLWKPTSPLPVSAPVPSARVPLFDAPRSGFVELPALAWSGDAPLPRRLDQDLPSSLTTEFEPSIALPSSLRF